ncbi:MAG: CocE/NonD family hydrolase [Proteobacteria bacterium]|nr:CocE/NonD family hydrolase [Pseudomonadota bacterium]
MPRGLLVLLLIARGAAAVDDGITIEEVWIEMPDGVLLAADLYKPTDLKPGDKLPVLLEYTAYRKTESRSRNYALFSYFLNHDYIVARVDIRGTGNSKGRLIPYEYADEELDDGEVIIDWLSKQPFSNGNVGMFGISWGGFNAVQLAVRQPPALKAIIAVHATEDLYQDDVHFMDGVMHLDSWEMSQELKNARPGAPDFLIDDDNFKNRFDTEPWVLSFKRQQRDGPFWDRASSRDKYDRIKIPAFYIAGWYDGYRDIVPRMLANVEAPVKAMIGAWSHAWPHDPYPQPGMEWRHEAVRWFDQFLKGEDTGILDEPRLAVYVREWHPPGPYLEYAPGFWRWEDGWPIDRIQQTRMYAQDNHSLSIAQADATVHSLRYTPTSGLEAGGPVMWWGDVAHDQRPTDAYSLVYDTEPLASDTEILGLPLARLNVSADAPRANWMVKLSDVAPDGRVTQVAGAAFNGTHRNSAREPRDIVPGEEFALDIEMHFTSWVFPKGHRIRFSVSNAQWPMLWPTPYPMTTTLRLGGAHGSHVELPIVPPGERASPEFLPPAANPKYAGYESIDTGMPSGYGEISAVTRNPRTGEATVTATNSGATKFPWGTETYLETIEHKTSDAHPENTSMTGTHRLELQLEGRTLLWEGQLSFTSDLENFYYEYSRKLSENGELVREKSWQETIPRDYQ